MRAKELGFLRFASLNAACIIAACTVYVCLHGLPESDLTIGSNRTMVLLYVVEIPQVVYVVIIVKRSLFGI